MPGEKHASSASSACFAFVIQERDSGRIVMARDRFGIKPL